MTREQARREIDSLDFYLQNHTDDYGEESHTAMMMAKDALSCSEKPNKWIPVSERLPEDEQEILFSTKTGRVQVGKYHDDDSANQWYSYRDKCRAWNNVVTAWMPLPAPYKGKDSEDKVEIIEPTDKQVDYVIDIARMLNIPLPAEKTKQAYSDFISKNVDEFKRIKMRNYLDDEDFGEFLGMGTWDIGL